MQIESHRITGNLTVYKKPDIVAQIEREYPEMTKEYWNIMMEQYETFCVAIDDTFQDLSVYGVICQLVKRGKWAK